MFFPVSKYPGGFGGLAPQFNVRFGGLAPQFVAWFGGLAPRAGRTGASRCET